jgi:hypothetical protein
MDANRAGIRTATRAAGSVRQGRHTHLCVLRPVKVLVRVPKVAHVQQRAPWRRVALLVCRHALRAQVPVVVLHAVDGLGLVAHLLLVVVYVRMSDHTTLPKTRLVSKQRGALQWFR